MKKLTTLLSHLSFESMGFKVKLKSDTMKNITTLLSVLVLTASSWQANAQCTFGSSWGTADAPASYGLTSTLTTCSFGNEYSTATNCVSGVGYEVTYTGGTGNYITIFDNTNTPVAWGLSPLTFTATYSGTSKDTRT